MLFQCTASTSRIRPVAGDATVEVSGGVLVTVRGTLAGHHVDEWYAGRAIRAPVQLRRPSRYLNPGVIDEERALARRGTTLVGGVKSGALVEIVDDGGVIARAAWRIRRFARRAIASAVGRWSTRSAAIVTAIVIGDRTGARRRRRTAAAGSRHLPCDRDLGRQHCDPGRRDAGGFRMAGTLGPAAMLTAIGGLLAYAWIVVGGASVTRATLMAVVYFAGRAIDLRAHAINGLALVAALIVAAQPLAIADPAFLLTFGATVAIVSVMPAAVLGRLPAAAGLADRRFSSPRWQPRRRSCRSTAFLFSRVTFAGSDPELRGHSADGRRPAGGHGRRRRGAGSRRLSRLPSAGWRTSAPRALCARPTLVEWMPVLTWRRRAARIGSQSSSTTLALGGSVDAVAIGQPQSGRRAARPSLAGSARRCRRRRRRRGVDPVRTLAPADDPRRRPSARHVHRRRAGRCHPRQISARRERSWWMPAARPALRRSISATASWAR